MDHFLLFGDSLTQMSYDCSRGFAFGAQLANGADPGTAYLWVRPWLTRFCGTLDYIRRLDVVNRGFR